MTIVAVGRVAKTEVERTELTKMKVFGRRNLLGMEQII